MIDFNDKQEVEKLIKGCIKGDRKKQKLLYQSLYGKMLGVCIRYSRDIEEAKDILHDGFIKVFTKLEKFEYKGSFEGWIRRIMVNNAIDYVRNRRDFLIEDDLSLKTNKIREEEDDEKEYQELVQLKASKIIELIQQLSPAYRTVFNMYVVENYSHKEIAEELNISIGTSKSNLAKAKMKLKELYNKLGENFE